MFETVKAHVKARVRRWVEEDRPAGDLAGPEWDDAPRALPAAPVAPQALRASPPPLPPSLRKAAPQRQDEDWDQVIAQAKRQANARAVDDDWAQAISRAKSGR